MKKKMMNQPERTAIERKKLSTPMKFLEEEGHLDGRTLDYGCGRGFDAGHLGLESYDPNFFHGIPEGKFDTITCNYVMNVVTEEVASWLINDIESRLAPGGHAFITVRRDLKEDTETQRNVKLDLPIVKETSGYCIYETWN